MRCLSVPPVLKMLPVLSVSPPPAPARDPPVRLPEFRPLYKRLYLVWGVGAPGPSGGRQVALVASRTGHVSTSVQPRAHPPLWPPNPTSGLALPGVHAPSCPWLCVRSCSSGGRAHLPVGSVQTLWPRCGAGALPFVRAPALRPGAPSVSPVPCWQRSCIPPCSSSSRCFRCCALPDWGWGPWTPS